MNFYIANTLVRLVANIVTITGTPVDAASIECKVRTPDGVVLDISNSIVRDGVGQYHVDYLPTQVGLIQYEWIGTGTVEVVGMSQFITTSGPF